MILFVDYIVENVADIGNRFLEHCAIVGSALAFAVPIGIALGVLLSRPRAERIQGVVFYFIGLGQTIPSLALLALAMGLLGIGVVPAIVAIALYAILPVARNTFTGIQSLPASTLDAARGLGMTPWGIIKSVEIPLALPYIIAGARIATVTAISAGALAYLIGGGGLGEYIFTGISLMKPEAMLAGAIPTAALALAADYGWGRLVINNY